MEERRSGEKKRRFGKLLERDLVDVFAELLPYLLRAVFRGIYSLLH